MYIYSADPTRPVDPARPADPARPVDPATPTFGVGDGDGDDAGRISRQPLPHHPIAPRDEISRSTFPSLR